MQDWHGNKKAVVAPNGDSSHSQQARCRTLPAEVVAFRRRKNEKRTNIYKWCTD